MVQNKQTPKAGINSWTFSGKVTKKDFKYSANGNGVMSILLRVPSKNEKFTTSVWIKAFKETAEQIEEQVKEDTNWLFKGYLSKTTKLDEATGVKKYYDNYIISRFEVADEADFGAVEEGKDSVPF